MAKGMKKISWKLVMKVQNRVVGEYEVGEHFALRALMEQQKGYAKRGITAKTRLEVLSRDNYTCQRCGVNEDRIPLQVHHIHQESEGGPDDMSNLITLCWHCHQDMHRPSNTGLMPEKQYNPDDGWRHIVPRYYAPTQYPPLKED